MSANRILKVILLFLIIGIGGLCVSINQYKKKDTPVVLGLNSKISTTSVNVETTNTDLVTNKTLKTVVDKALEGTIGTYGIVIKNLKTGESYSQNEKMIFDTASLYKIWIMATVYRQIDNGQLQEDDVLTEDVVELNKKFDIDPEFAELKEGVVTFTIREALNQMITISHNYAALILTAKIRLSNVATFLKENNLNESTVGTSGGLPTATPSDISLFFEKLYKGELASQDSTEKMISLLKKQQLNDGLPKYLPDESIIANKTGEMNVFKHDAGIVFSNNGDYIIVVMSKSDDTLAAQERIALVSKGVFEYFNK